MHGHGIADGLWGKVHRAAMGFLAVICVSLGARIPAAAADVTYDYTGNEIFSYGNPTTPAGNVTVTATFDISPGYTGGARPTLYTISAAGISLSYPDVGENDAFVDFTNGQITQWFFSVESPPSTPTSPFPDIGTINNENFLPSPPYGTGATDFIGTANGLCLVGCSNGSDPGTWTLALPPPPTSGFPTSAACTADVAGAVSPSTSSGYITSASGLPINITATFTPTDGSLMQAAMDCGVQSFDWQQTVDQLPGPSPFYANDEPGVSLTAPPSFLDPAPGGYNYPLYCTNVITPPVSFIPFTNVPPSVNNPAYVTASNPSAAEQFPFYYEPNGLSTDCGTAAYHTTPTTMSFFDSPADPLLPTGDNLAFTTCLVGVNSAENPVPLPSSDQPCFSWTDTYTGLGNYENCTTSGAMTNCTITGLGTGGIDPDEIVQLDSAITSGYPGLGTGGIEIISAPEPSAAQIFMSGIGLMMFVRGRRPRGRAKSILKVGDR
jgi:hypothetical protein